MKQPDKESQEITFTPKTEPSKSIEIEVPLQTTMDPT